MNTAHVVFEVRWDVSTSYQMRTRRQQFDTEAEAVKFRDGHARSTDMTIFKITTEKVG